MTPCRTFLSTSFFGLLLLCSVLTTTAFVPASTTTSYFASTTTSATTNPKSRSSFSDTSLNAVGALVRKAKEAALREYVANGIEDDVMEEYKKISKALEEGDDTNDNLTDGSSTSSSELGPLQFDLTKRKGTITVIAEYKRKLIDSGYINEVFEPVLLSNEFREFGAAAMSVMCDERMGGCTYDDLRSVAEEQRRSKNEVPGPIKIINNDIIIDELQIARTAACGADAVLITLDIVGEELAVKLLKACAAVNIEAILAVATLEEAQKAVDIGATMISVINVDGPDAKKELINGLSVPEGRTVTTIANIAARMDKGLEEVEEAWACRDNGFNCAWISDALYKAGNSMNEHPGAIVKSMRSKSSLRWASPVAQSGRGEGAREYLGDIMM